MRALYRLLSVWWQLKAASRGPAAFVRQRLRSAAHRALARAAAVVPRFPGALGWSRVLSCEGIAR